MSKKIKWSVGDRVKDDNLGEGWVIDISDSLTYSVCCNFDKGVITSFTNDGKRWMDSKTPTLKLLKRAKILTQHDYISLSLADGESISNKNAYAFCGTMKLSTRIGEIEKAHNVAFKRTPEQHILKCNGRKGNHTVYSLDGALSEQSTEFQNYIKSLTQ